MSDSIWDWVYDFIWNAEGPDEEIADKIEDFSSLAYAKNQSEVEAIFPELLAYARERDNKWLEVFLRHWRLQAYVNTQLDPRPLVPEVLDLLAFTQTDEAAGECPQATCVIDDLNDIYSGIDAAGFAQERHDLLKEQLVTLSPSRECYMCMSVGMVDALVDLGKPQDALAFWKDACKSSTAITEVMQEGSHFDTYISESIVRAQNGAGDYEAALDLINKATPKDAVHASRTDLHKVEALLGLGRNGDANTLFNNVLERDAEDIAVRDACNTMQSMLAIGWAPAADRVENLFWQIAERSKARGRIREAFDAAHVAGLLWVKAGKPANVSKALAFMKEVSTEFNRPAGADAQIATLEDAL